MSLDKGIQYGKEKRKPYRGSKTFDASCRNHGDCPFCAEGRQNKTRMQKAIAKRQIDEVDEGDDYESFSNG